MVQNTVNKFAGHETVMAIDLLDILRSLLAVEALAKCTMLLLREALLSADGELAIRLVRAARIFEALVALGKWSMLFDMLCCDNGVRGAGDAEADTDAVDAFKLPML